MLSNSSKRYSLRSRGPATASSSSSLAAAATSVGPVIAATTSATTSELPSSEVATTVDESMIIDYNNPSRNVMTHGGRGTFLQWVNRHRTITTNEYNDAEYIATYSLLQTMHGHLSARDSAFFTLYLPQNDLTVFCMHPMCTATRRYARATAAAAAAAAAVAAEERNDDVETAEEEQVNGDDDGDGDGEDEAEEEEAEEEEENNGGGDDEKKTEASSATAAAAAAVSAIDNLGRGGFDIAVPMPYDRPLSLKVMAVDWAAEVEAYDKSDGGITCPHCQEKVSFRDTRLYFTLVDAEGTASFFECFNRIQMPRVPVATKKDNKKQKNNNNNNNNKRKR